MSEENIPPVDQVSPKKKKAAPKAALEPIPTNHYCKVCEGPMTEEEFAQNDICRSCRFDMDPLH